MKKNITRLLRIKGFIVKLIKKVFRHEQNNSKYYFHDLENYFLNKNGLEIGGPSGFFSNGYMPIYNKMASLDGVNFSTSTIWSGLIDEKKGFILNNKRVGEQYILDAVNLNSIEKNIYDFVLSCNNIEHIANPIKAVEQWVSVLKPGGILVVIAPRKESNFDHNRKHVKFEHLICDYEINIAEDDLTHLKEILTLHDLKMDPLAGTFEQFTERSLKNFENRCLHQHVFNLNVLNRIYKHLNLNVIKSVQLDSDYVIVGQKIYIKDYKI